jgi:transposase
MEVAGSCAADVIRQATILDFVDLAERVPKDHPLRTIKTLAAEVLDRLAPEFERMYSKVGRASVPPERLLKAS